jgi:hypothetical protein
MRHLTLCLILALLPAAALAQSVAAPGARPAGSTTLRIEAGPRQDQRALEQAVLAQAERELTARHGAGHPYDLRTALRAGQVSHGCQSTRAGWVCTVAGQVCVPSAVVPACAGGTLRVDALGMRDMCAGGTATSAGIAAPTCPTGYALAELAGADACRIR